MTKLRPAFVVALALLALACRSEAPLRSDEADLVTDASLADADADVDDWLSYGRTYAESRMSPLDQIHEGNVASLGLA